MNKYYNVIESGTWDDDSQWKILIGERSNGKSYSVTEECIKEAYNEISYLGLIKRWDIHVTKSKVEQYFNHIDENNISLISKATNNKYDFIEYKSHKLYFNNHITSKRKENPPKLCGYVFGLSVAEGYKSLQYPNTYNIIFEEFITDQSYLNDEPTKLMHLVSTILRNNNGRVFLIGNTLSRMTPYYDYWGLDRIPYLTKGNKDKYEFETKINNQTYKTKILVEFCSGSNFKSSMFAGKAAENINGGSYEVDLCPRADSYIQRLARTECRYKFIVEKYGFTFTGYLLYTEELGNFIYIERKTSEIKKDTRLITFTELLAWNNNKATLGFIPLVSEEAHLFKLLKMGKVCFDTNATGTDFRTHIIKEL